MASYEQYSAQYSRRWQERIIKTCYLSAVVIVAFEIAYYFIITAAGLRDQSAIEYILKFIVTPGSVILATCCIGGYIVKSSSLATEGKSLAVIMTMVVICATVATIHNIFPAIMFSFFVPLSISIVFGKRWITNVTGVCCVLGEAIAMIAAMGDLRGNDPYFLLDCLMLFIVFGILWYTALLLITNEQEKRHVIDNMKQEKDMLEQKICRDELTGLYNLLGLQLYADGKMQEEYGKYKNSSLAFLDIDNFKGVNDTFGHEMGNRVLIEIADGFKCHFPEKSCIARYGGDEFVVLLPAVSTAECKKIMDALLENMSCSHMEALSGGTVSLSCGICRYDFCTPVLEAITTSDKAMYKAKTMGKNCTIIAH